MVFKKTGRRKKVFVRTLTSLAACLALLVGARVYMSYVSHTGELSPQGEEDKIVVADYDEEADEDTEDEFDAATMFPHEEIESYVREEYGSESDSKDKKNKDREDDTAGTDDDVQTGDYGKLTTLSSDEIDDVFRDYANEIDMDALEIYYDTLEAMVSDCDYIVRGEKVSQSLKSTEKKYQYTLIAKYEVACVLQDNTGKDISEDIKVNENILIDEKKELVTYVGGYNYMKNGAEYILFLKKSEKGYYDIAGRIYGKVPLNENEDALYIDGSYSQEEYIKNIYRIIDFAREKYTE